MRTYPHYVGYRMPRPLLPLPKPRFYRPTGAAVIDCRDPNTHARGTVTLGPWGSPQAQAEYARLLASHRVGSTPTVSSRSPADLTEVLVRYVTFIDGCYRDPDGRPTGTAEDIRVTLGYVNRLLAPVPLADLGPPHLKAVRQAMIDNGRVRGRSTSERPRPASSSAGASRSSSSARPCWRG